MKIKNLFVAMLAGAAMVSCSNEDFESGVNNGAFKNGEKGYVAVNIAAPSATRAISGFEAGSTEEVTVSKAVFLFLNENFEGCADPCVVEGRDIPEFSNATGDGQDKQATVLVIENNKEVPAYIVAVLNPVGVYNADTDLADLKAEHADYTACTNSNFVMSNAVYKGTDGKEVAATPITMDNIKSSAELAEAAPVTIQVERVVAKVEVDLGTAAENWSGAEEFDGCETKELALVIDGWDILQNTESTTLKNINLTWDHNWWNDAAKMRSYWAVDYTDGDRNSLTVADMETPEDGFRYVEETVNQTANDENKQMGNDVNPYLVVAAHFVEAGTTNPVSLVEWRSRKYTLNGYLNFIVSNSKVAQYWYKTGEGEYSQFSADLLEMTPVESAAWKNQATLTATAAAYEYGTFNYDAAGNRVEGSWTSVATSAVKAAVAEFGEVQYWNGGKTYYYTPITHETVGTGDAAQKYYGVVRNHLYKVTINSISGYGTPVANPGHVIEVPERPTDDESYLAAKVVILDWAVVNNLVDLQ